MKKSSRNHSRRSTTYRYIGLSIIIVAILAFFYRFSLPSFTTTPSVNKIIEEFADSNTTEAEQKVIDEVNEAADKEARTKPGTKAHQQATYDLYLSGQKLEIVRDIERKEGDQHGELTGIRVDLEDVAAGGDIEQQAIADLKKPPVGTGQDRIVTLNPDGTLTEEAYQSIADSHIARSQQATAGSQNPSIGITGTSCTGAFGSIPSGNWVATGYARNDKTGARCTEADMKTGQCNQDECVYCSGISNSADGTPSNSNINDTGYALDNDKTGDNTKYLTASCGDKLKEDPRKVIMPPDPSSRFWTSSTGTEAIKPPAACVGNMPSGTISGGNTCFDGRMVPNSQLGSAISQYCVQNNASSTDCQSFANDYTGCTQTNMHYDTSTNKCVTNIAVVETKSNPCSKVTCTAENTICQVVGGVGKCMGRAGAHVDSESECISGQALRVYIDKSNIYYKCTGGANGDPTTDPGNCASGYANKVNGQLVCATCKAGANQADPSGSSYYTCEDGKTVYHSCPSGAVYVSNGTCLSKTIGNYGKLPTCGPDVSLPCQPTNSSVIVSEGMVVSSVSTCGKNGGTKVPGTNQYVCFDKFGHVPQTSQYYDKFPASLQASDGLITTNIDSTPTQLSTSDLVKTIQIVALSNPALTKVVGGSAGQALAEYLNDNPDKAQQLASLVTTTVGSAGQALAEYLNDNPEKAQQLSTFIADTANTALALNPVTGPVVGGISAGQALVDYLNDNPEKAAAITDAIVGGADERNAALTNPVPPVNPPAVNPRTGQTSTTQPDLNSTVTQFGSNLRENADTAAYTCAAGIILGGSALLGGITAPIGIGIIAATCGIGVIAAGTSGN